MRGSLPEAMADAGFSSEQIRVAGESFRVNFCEPGSIGQDVMDDAAVRALVRHCRDVALSLDLAGTGLTRWVVEVDITDRSCREGRFCVETSVCEVLARDDLEATLMAAQLVAAIHDDGNAMIVATRVVDWPD